MWTILVRLRRLDGEPREWVAVLNLALLLWLLPPAALAPLMLREGRQQERSEALFQASREGDSEAIRAL